MTTDGLMIMSDKDYNRIIDRINKVSQELLKYVEQTCNPMKEKWLDNADACRLLKVSSRSMQNYRDKGILPFSSIGGKIYYKASDIEFILTKNYTQNA